MSDKSRPNQGSPMRYELRNGKWGLYFHDTENDWDMPLQDVLDILNLDAERTTVQLEALSERYQRLRQRTAAVVAHMLPGTPIVSLVSGMRTTVRLPGCPAYGAGTGKS